MKLLRRVFDEQFKVVEGKLELVTQRPARAVQNPHDPDAHYADKKTKQWTGYKVHVTETVDPEEPIKKKGEPTEHFITEMFTTEAAQDEMAGLTEVLKREQQHHEITPQAMYSDAGYVTEHTLTQAEQNGIELLGPTRPDPHKGAYNSDAFQVDVDKRQAVCPEGKLSTQCSRIKDSFMGTEYYRLEWASQCDSCPVQKQCTRSKSGRRTLVVGLRHDLVRAAAQRNERGRVLKAHASEKRHRRNAQRVGAWARLETDEISRLKPGRSIELLHRRCLQCEAILKSPRIPDENAGSEPGLRAQDSSFSGYGIVAGENLPAAKLFCYP